MILIDFLGHWLLLGTALIVGKFRQNGEEAKVALGITSPLTYISKYLSAFSNFILRPNPLLLWAKLTSCL